MQYLEQDSMTEQKSPHWEGKETKRDVPGAVTLAKDLARLSGLLPDVLDLLKLVNENNKANSERGKAAKMIKWSFCASINAHHFEAIGNPPLTVKESVNEENR